MSEQTTKILFGILAGVGVLVVLAEIVLHIAGAVSRSFDYEINDTVLIVAAILGFVGFWGIDSKRTKEGFAVVTSIIPRFGRRSTDAIAVPTAETKVVAEPVAVPPDPAAGSRTRDD